MAGSRAGDKGLFVYVPEDLHKKFRMKVTRLGLSQKTVLLDFLEAFCKERETNGPAINSK